MAGRLLRPLTGLRQTDFIPELDLCQQFVTIATNPDYASLNLAQAVQVLAYECRVAELGEGRLPTTTGFQGQLATAEQVEGLFGHLEKALVEIDFLDPAQPKKLMPRLRRLFARTALETEEVNILRGIANQILNKKKS